MTLNKWEQSNIEVLTSREMGEWLGRRENRLFDKISAEIAEYKDDKVIHAEQNEMIDIMLEIIDKYRG